ncbi:aldo/keto reductase [Streptomyces sp. C]|uniref:aldo/keto reductase n=1 Tax=Streptomyces sp. C TaxID=253839 RepID=UPI0001B5421E|nr:aldo/keto reductase [Streptomyces sp. C]
MREPDPRIVLGLHRSRYERRALTSALDLGITTIDTSFNYRGFTAHATLADVAGDLLPHLTLSTKVGFFPAAGQAEHSLHPARLRVAMEQTNRDLGRVPDLVFLHNPERSLPSPAAEARDTLGRACATLATAVEEGLCGAWGISTWDPRPLTSLADATLPRPAVLMVRAGLLAGISVLEASEALVAQWDLAPDQVWGMSPFGGDAADPVWGRLDPRVFIADADDAPSALQAAFRAAFLLPEVGRIAVGTDNPTHLQELIDALRYEPDSDRLRTYRQMLRERASRQVD